MLIVDQDIPRANGNISEKYIDFWVKTVQKIIFYLWYFVLINFLADCFLSLKQKMNSAQRKSMLEHIEEYLSILCGPNTDKKLEKWSVIADILNTLGPKKSSENWRKVGTLIFYSLIYIYNNFLTGVDRYEKSCKKKGGLHKRCWWKWAAHW